MTTPEHTIAALCQRSRDISLEKGWLNPDGTDPRPFHTVVALFHSELSEAFEEVRNHQPLAEVYYEVKMKDGMGTTEVRKHISRSAMLELAKLDGKYGRGWQFLEAKPCGIPIELADFVIRVCQWAGSTGQVANLLGGAAVAEDETIEEILPELHRYVSLAYHGTVHGDLEFCSYLADSLALVFSFCEKNGIDLWAAIDEKEAFNRTRPIRHGGKAC